MSEHYHRTPAEIVCVNDEYEAFCFNEACYYISAMMSKKHKPNFKNFKGNKDKGIRHYSRLSLLYEEIKSSAEGNKKGG